MNTASSAVALSRSTVAFISVVLTVAKEVPKSKSAMSGRLLLRLSTRSVGIKADSSILRLPTAPVADEMIFVTLKISKS